MTDNAPTLNLDQVYADAENRQAAIAKENEADEKMITEAKARITARRDEAKTLERLLRSRTPRTVNRAPKDSKASGANRATATPPVQADAEGEPV